MYHFALLHTDNMEKPAKLQGKWVERRKGSAIIDEMLDKTILLNAEEKVSNMP